MSAISYAEAQTLVLDRLRDWLARIPEAERIRPRIVRNFVSYSIIDMINEIERDTDVGRKYVYDQAKFLGYVIE